MKNAMNYVKHTAIHSRHGFGFEIIHLARLFYVPHESRLQLQHSNQIDFDEYKKKLSSRNAQNNTKRKESKHKSKKHK